MKLDIYQIDSFTDQLFQGNPAAVCPLKQWLPDEVLLKIATENNLSETAFYLIKDNQVEIRWFTPSTEVDLCGHATLATAFVLKNHENFVGDCIPFYSPRSGPLPVQIQDDLFVMNFPADNFTQVPLSEDLKSVIDIKPIAAYKGRTDYLLLYENEQQIRNLKPDLLRMSEIAARGFIATAKGESWDFVSRFFAPAVGVNEDPVCGSAHTTLTPFWSDRLGKNELEAYQLSQRTGYIRCKLLNERVEIAGKATLYMKGTIFI